MEKAKRTINTVLASFLTALLLLGPAYSLGNPGMEKKADKARNARYERRTGINMPEKLEALYPRAARRPNTG